MIEHKKDCPLYDGKDMDVSTDYLEIGETRVHAFVDWTGILHFELESDYDGDMREDTFQFPNCPFCGVAIDPKDVYELEKADIEINRDPTAFLLKQEKHNNKSDDESYD